MKGSDSVTSTIVAVVASITTTFTLLWAVVSLSEPQRSQLIAGKASRQMINQGDVALAQPGPSQPASAQPEVR